MKMVLSKEDRVQVAIGTKTLFKIEPRYRFKDFSGDRDQETENLVWNKLPIIQAAGCNDLEAVYRVVKFYFEEHQRIVDRGCEMKYAIVPGRLCIARTTIIDRPNPKYYLSADE